MKAINRCPDLLIRLIPVLAACLASVGCEIREEINARTVRDEPSPEETRYLAAARPFVDAVLARDYAGAYAQLSRDARASMNLNQFVPPLDDQQYERNRAKALSNVQPADFSAWMKRVEEQHGSPAKLMEMSVYSTDPRILAGKAEGLDQLDVMFAIGAMPKSIPGDIRRASVRCQIGTRLSDVQMKQAAQDMDMSIDQLRKDANFAPYFTLKLVLVDEDGGLKVGYFEFLPPSMLD